jgi:hypothetical protein
MHGLDGRPGDFVLRGQRGRWAGWASGEAGRGVGWAKNQEKKEISEIKLDF